MNKLKRTAALLMAAGLSLSMLAGCGTPGQDSTSASPGAEQNTTVGAAEGYTYKIATVRWNDTWPTDFLTDGVMGDLAKEADIDIEWQIYYSNDFGEQKALLFASDDLPDAFFGSCGLGDSDIVQNKEKLLELTDLINEETMPNLMKIFEEDPTMRMACTDRNEQIYSLPKKIPFRPKLNSQNYINKEWLDNLNLEMPTNYDELKEVLIAFKEQDADGDGDPNNEIPISGYKPGYGSVLLDSFDLIERGVINPGVMVSHILGMAAVPDTIYAMEHANGAKKVCYNALDLPLVALSDFAELGKTDPLYARLDELVKSHGNVWCPEAEAYLLAHAKRISE